MTDAILPTALHLGFLTVFAGDTGFLGGYLVTRYKPMDAPKPSQALL